MKVARDGRVGWDGAAAEKYERKKKIRSHANYVEFSPEKIE